MLHVDHQARHRRQANAGMRASSPHAPRGLRHRVLDFAWPVIAQNLLETTLGIVGTVLVAGLGTHALAGVGSALQIMLVVLAALSALAAGSAILVALAVGAGDSVRASHLARQALMWGVLGSLPLAGTGLALAAPLISIFGLDPAAAQVGAAYLQVLLGTIPVMAVSLIAGALLRGAGDSRTPMVVSAIVNTLNMVLAYGLITGRWGCPALGVTGSAWATVLARTLSLVVLVHQLYRGCQGVSLARGGSWRLDWLIARQVLWLGIPAALEQTLLAGAFLAVTFLVARLGAPTLAAQRIQISALSLAFVPGVGFGIAATTVIAQSLGARRPFDVGGVARVATTWAVLWMSGIALLLLMYAPPIMHLFTSELDVIRAGASGLRIVALTQPFWAVSLVLSGALRGTGNTRFALIVGSAGAWSAVLLAWLGLQVMGGGLAIVWGAFLVTAPLTALATFVRFRRCMRELEASAATPAARPENVMVQEPHMS